MTANPRARFSMCCACILLGLLSVGCGEGDTGTKAALPSIAAETDVDISAVAADPTGGGWLLDRGSKTSRALYHFGASGDQDKITDVPSAPIMSMRGLTDGRVAVSSLECRTTSDCESAVGTVLVLGTDGDTDFETEVATAPRNGGLEDGDGLRLVGEVDGTLWVDTFAQTVVGVRLTDGRIDSRIPSPSGAVCIVNGQMQSLESLDPPPAEGEAINQSPAEDPAHPHRVEVYAFDGSKFSRLPGSDHEYPSNGQAGCVGGAFAAYVEREPVADLWTGSDWSTTDWSTSPELVTGIVLGTASDQMAIDTNGELIINERGRWQRTGALFDTDRGSDDPPPWFYPDRAGEVVVACVATSGGADFACSVGTAQ